MGRLDHPNDAGRWSRLAEGGVAALWKREHTAFPPLTQYYVIAPPRQHQIFYREPDARRVFDDLLRLTAGPTNEATSSPRHAGDAIEA